VPGTAKEKSIVPEMRKVQKEKTDEGAGGGTTSYFRKCVAIVRPVRGRIVVTAMFAITILAVDLKYTVEGSSWMYSIINAAMIAAGIGLAVLSTAVVVKNETRK
jgi:hypothetical protein